MCVIRVVLSEPVTILQVDGPELHDNIEPLDIPGVELEETEVRHKDYFETVDLLFYALDCRQWCKECYRKIPPF